MTLLRFVYWGEWLAFVLSGACFIKFVVQGDALLSVAFLVSAFAYMLAALALQDRPR